MDEELSLAPFKFHMLTPNVLTGTLDSQKQQQTTVAVTSITNYKEDCSINTLRCEGVTRRVM